jgi:hypothetical protein
MHYKFLSILVLNSSDNYYIGYYSEHDFNIKRCSSRLTVTKRMSLIEQELHIIPESMTSLSVLSRVRVAQFIVFCVTFCRSLFLLLSLFVCPLYCMSFVHCIVCRLSIVLYVVCPLYCMSFVHCIVCRSIDGF